ncbi:hypothetical protein CYY_009189 [Polysphondylium violaceum]|uniref:Sister chromatid cohesion protein DCC1 n=1 Tax=Polysphondylium violaceum TaxID=133409 RepID=A0A8J4PU17_9MYCE|nr:hypothetical protein CYY_009189 [Polysphondylium violaceum]
MDTTINVNSIEFSNDYPNQSYYLLEVTNEIVDEIKKENKSNLVIKGLPNEDAVLCTKDKTFIIKGAQTSNAILLVSKNNDKVSTLFQQHLELIETKPRLNSLHTLVESKSLKSNLEYEEQLESNSLGLSMNEILDNTQASENETLSYLSKINSFTLSNGNIIKLSDEYKMRIIDLIIAEITINSWSLEKVPIKDCIENLKSQVPKEILLQCINIYSLKADQSTTTEKEQEEDYFKFNTNLLCIDRAKQLLLLSSKGDWQYETFMENWKDSLSFDLKPTFDILRGLAIINVNKGSTQRFVKYIDQSTLSLLPKNRFKELFQLSSRWTIDTIEPYINTIIPPKTSLEQFILTYSRAISSPNGEKTIVPRV